MKDTQLLWCLQLFFLKLAGAEIQKTFRCDYQYKAETDSFYKIHKIPANFHEARLRCHMSGATLASPTNAKELRIQVELMKQQYQNVDWFTGIHSTFSQCDYFSIEGTHISKIKKVWNSVLYPEPCVLMDTTGSLARTNCNYTYPYICYKKYNSSMTVNKCGTIDNEYKLDARTGSCYKVHVVARPWSRAFLACAAEGAHLAVIDSQLEAQLLKDLLANYPESRIESLGPKDLLFVGIHDWGEPGDWLSVHGRSLKETGYSEWAPGQPDNATSGGESCGAIYRSGLLGDVPCARAHAFICEKDPDSLRYCTKNTQKLNLVQLPDPEDQSSTEFPINVTTGFR